MGLFGRFFNTVKNVANKINNTFGTAVEKIGKVLHSEKIRDIGDTIQFKSNYGMWNYYDSGNSTVEETVDFIVDIDEKKTEIMPQVENIEKQRIKQVVGEVSSIVDEIFEIFNENDMGGFPELLAVKEICESDINDRLSGELTQSITKMFSSNNSKLHSGDSDEINKYLDNSTKRRIGTYEKKCDDVLYEYRMSIKDLFSKKLDSMENDFIGLEDSVKKFIDANNDEEEINKQIADILYEKAVSCVLYDYCTCNNLW